MKSVVKHGPLRNQFVAIMFKTDDEGDEAKKPEHFVVYTCDFHFTKRNPIPAWKVGGGGDQPQVWRLGTNLILWSFFSNL